MDKDHINAKISEALSTYLEVSEEREKIIRGEKIEWEERLFLKFSRAERNEFGELKVTFDWNELTGFIRAEKEKRESEIKSALETIDWDN